MSQQQIPQLRRVTVEVVCTDDVVDLIENGVYEPMVNIFGDLIGLELSMFEE